MPINIGYIDNPCNDGEVSIRIFYDETFAPAGPEQPLVDAPVGKVYEGGVVGHGYCLEFINKTGRTADATISNGTQTITVRVAQGDPVTTGPANGRSRTAAQMAALGYTKRGDITNIQLQC